MNKKKIISIAIFMFIILFGAGFAYFLNPAAVNTISGIDTAQIDAVSLDDISALDSATSSLPAHGPQPAAAAPPMLPIKMPIKKKKSAAAPIAPVTQADSAQDPVISSGEQPVIVPFAQNTGTVMDDISVPSSSLLCSFPNGAQSSSRQVIFNEVAWMGSPSSSNAEWIELKNISASDVDLSGWELATASGKIKILFVGGDTIAPGGLMMLSRGSGGGGNDVSGPEKIYSGDLANAGDTLVLIDPHCVVSDHLDASNGWPAGNNATKQTLERDADGIGWHMSALPGGTPGAENSAGPPPTQYTLSVAFEGDASGATITSDPAGLVCGASCAGSFASGTQITLTPTAGADTVFNGWSGSCYGETVCSFAIAANTSFTVQFRSTLPLPAVASGSVDNADNPSFTPGITTSTADSPVADGHILMAAVQIAGASSSNDLVKMYNPTASAIDMSGWKLRKKSQTGADYSLKIFPAGSTIAAGQSFVWANSIGGFSEMAGANVSSTETLSADNSVALMDASGTIIDAVAWGTGVGQYGEGPPYPMSPGVNQLLSRRSSDNAMADTDDNTNDFTLQ